MTVPPDLALLVPCFNAARYLPELFATARSQTVPFTEILCYDDASTDDTSRVAEALGARVIRGEENRGAAYSRNRLVEATACSWVHFHDADDILHPKFVERMWRWAEEGDSPVLCGMLVRDRTTREVIGRVSYMELNRVDVDPVAFFLEHMGFGIVGIYRRGTLETVGGFREDLRGGEDPDLHIRLAISGSPFRAEEAELVTNLMHPDSFSRRERATCLRDRLRCFEGYAEVLPPVYHRILGVQSLALGDVLLGVGDRVRSRRALALAARLGVRTVDSHRPFTRTLSRLLGPEPVLQARRAFARLRKMVARSTSGKGNQEEH